LFDFARMSTTIQYAVLKQVASIKALSWNSHALRAQRLGQLGPYL